MTIAEAGTLLRNKRVSSIELTRECLRQIEKLNPSLNAFITVTADLALARAAEFDRERARGMDRGPLHGIPIAHKDLMWTNGIRTTSGSKIFADFVPTRDAAVVKSLDDVGAVMIGKTGLHELAYGITSDNPHYGTIRNPRDPERSPGGSSGGSAVAVATGMAFMATGTDTGGSIRVPASFCGVVGLKPTFGLIDRRGVQPLGYSLDHVGPITRTVADARVSLEAMLTKTSPKPAPANLRGIRIGLPENFFFDLVVPEIKDAVHAAARQAEKFGAHLIPIRVPDMEAFNAAILVTLLAEAAAVHKANLHRRGDFGPDVLAMLDQGAEVRATDYVNAQLTRRRFRRQFRKLFERIDCLFTPTTPIAAPRIGQSEIELGGAKYPVRPLTTRFMRAFNALGLPALSIPCGQTMPRGQNHDGLPIGLQLVARPLEEGLLLNLGGALETDR
ncbi:MAG TPA: amidase [Bryobacteraceae bacterium]|nr:amidase [Bryobacteraceae bacterium]